MGQTKKHAKGRLDKYYHLAKEQGYRARSAFKLIQLNKKYSFLETAKVTVDLCAAPGGWCQVAHKYMPKPSIIIGLDLAPIKPITGVITHVQDITTAQCRATLKKELKTWKADVFLHDGAPNVGVSWAQDAFTQSELVLSALKLASEFLVPGGTFVTKVFRSKDYNKLMWVFNQLFAKVEATKPTASRSVSAEIFVVCQEYYAPKKIDPRLLDPAYAFKEVDDIDEPVVLDAKQIKEQQGQMMNELFHPEKRTRHREGYADGANVLHTTCDVSEFVQSIDFLGLLVRSNTMTFGPNPLNEQIKQSKLTTEEILEYLGDLKVLGKKEFKMLIKWRDHMRIFLKITPPKIDKDAEANPVAVVEKTIEEQIQEQREETEHRLKKERKKKRERKAKLLIRLQLGMETPIDIGIEGSNPISALPDIDMGDGSDDEKAHKDDSASEAESLDSDQEREAKIARLDKDMDELYNTYKQRKIDKNPSAKVTQVKEGIKAAFEEWYGVESDKKMPKTATDGHNYNSSSDDSSDDDEEVPVVEEDTTQDKKLSSQAAMFFDQPLFKNNVPEAPPSNIFDTEMVIDDHVAPPPAAKKERTRKTNNNDIEMVPIEEAKGGEESDDADEGHIIDSAAAYTIAQQLTTKSGTRNLINASFNRYAYNDPDELPEWFLQDESKHNKPSMPVTKEAVKIMQDRMRALDARPIKKVAEAKFRKQMRTQRRIEKGKGRAEGLTNDEDLGEKGKMEAIAKIMNKAKSAKRTERERPKLVVARGTNRANKGRPKGVKGRYKVKITFI